MFRINYPLQIVGLLLLSGILTFAFSFTALGQEKNGGRPRSAPVSILDSNRQKDGLRGPVRRVKTETARLSVKSGKVVEGTRVLLETTTYNPRGARISDMSYPVPNNSSTGREEYEYDNQGNITEIRLRDTNGSILSRQVHKYVFDSFGNWTKMTTLVPVEEGGAVGLEPTEVTYRTITYYYNKGIDRTGRGDLVAASVPVESSTHIAREVKVANKMTERAAGESVAAFTEAASDQSEPAPSATLRPRVESVSYSSLGLIIGPPTNTQANAPVSRDVRIGKAINLVKPAYLVSAVRLVPPRSLSVEVAIDENGKVISARALNGPRQLQAAAVAAARESRFTPSLVSGTPVESSGVIEYKFSFAP